MFKVFSTIKGWVHRIFNAAELWELIIDKLLPIKHLEGHLMITHPQEIIPLPSSFRTHLTTPRIIKISPQSLQVKFQGDTIFQINLALATLFETNEAKFARSWCQNRSGTGKQIIKEFLRIIQYHHQTLLDPRNINIIICKDTILQNIVNTDYIHLKELLYWLQFNIRPQRTVNVHVQTEN